MRNKVAALLLAGLLLVPGLAHATNYVLGYSAVDGGEIRWGGSTAYSGQWDSAIATWNGRSVIYIAADTSWTLEDLTISDVYRSDVAWTGNYVSSAGADNIYFNTYHLNRDTTDQIRNTATHELGHALGLAHSYSGNVMYSAQTSQVALGSQDIADYHYLWGY